MADQNSIPPNLPIIQDKKPAPPSPSPIPTKPAVLLPGSLPSTFPNPNPPSGPAAVPVLPPPKSAVAPPTPPPRPIRSFIRTMEGDIQAAQAGKTPQGIEKKLPSLSPTIPSQLPPPTKPVFLPPPSPKPLPPSSPVSPKSLVTVPAPLSVPPLLISKSEASKPETFLLSKDDQKPTPSPIVPLVPSRRSPNVPVGISTWFKNPRNIVVAVIILAALGFTYWFLMGSRIPRDEVITPSPAQTVSAIPTPRISKLLSFFFDYRHLTISSGEGKELTSIEPEIIKLNPQFKGTHILLNPQSEFGEDYTWSSFLSRFIVDFPVNLLSFVDEQDFDLILSQQQEKFDKGGVVVENFGDTRVAMAVRVTDTQQARNLMLDWEDSLFDNLDDFFALPKTSVAEFKIAMYRDVAIRYYNFPYPDRSVDYAIVTANNNDDYLIIANSREQMFGLIDVLLGFGTPGQ